MKKVKSKNMITKIEESLKYIASRSKLKPKFGITLGSGLSGFTSGMKVETVIPFKNIPHFFSSSVEGHPGNLILGYIESVPVVVLQGRVHFYEGHALSQVVHPTRVITKMGIQKLILTNAAGGLDKNMQPGDLMIITDHINLTGQNALIGPNNSELGPRFPAMGDCYDPEMNQLAETLLIKHKMRFSKGVYCGVTGPTYETAAEIKYLAKIGGSAVGMSTVHENIVARHMGLKVCGISCISNLGTGLSSQEITHEEVSITAAAIEKKFIAFLNEFITKL